MKAEIAKICQVCGHEEDVEECPECTRYTCQECFSDMRAQGLSGKQCMYCGFVWYVPSGRQIKTVGHDELARFDGNLNNIPLPEGAASSLSDEDLVDNVTDEQLVEDSYSRNFREALSGEGNFTRSSDARFRMGIADRNSDARFRAEPIIMDRADLTPYPPAPSQEGWAMPSQTLTTEITGRDWPPPPTTEAFREIVRDPHPMYKDPLMLFTIAVTIIGILVLLFW